MIGKLVEQLYVESISSLGRLAVKEKWWSSASVNDRLSSNPDAALDIIRKSLGHPLDFVSPVKCIVAGVHGLDSESAPDRLKGTSFCIDMGANG